MIKHRIISFFLLLALSQLIVLAGPAYPHPIQVTQPDGSKITIQIHGDEYLHWITCGNSLVAKADDGYYHLAEFDENGNSVPTANRVGSGISVVRSDGSGVTPPKSAFENAYYKRLQEDTNPQLFRRAPSKNNSSPQNSISIGKSKRFLVLLVEFTDTKFTINGGGENARIAFDNQLNQSGYSDNSCIGSVRDYFMENSKGVFVPEFDVVGPITVNGTLSKYAADDGLQGTVRDMLGEAAQLIDSQVDFSQYDHDSDGYIDNVFIYYAGYSASEGASPAIWPHSSSYSGSKTFDGKYLSKYACSSELLGKSGTAMTGIGAFCHEFSHVLGLADLYDTDAYSFLGGYYEDIGEYSLMDLGCYKGNSKIPPYLVSEERRMLGWLDETQLVYLTPNQTKEYVLPPIQASKFYISPTDKNGEFFLYEFRNGERWDMGLNPGVVIFHVDHSDNTFGILGWKTAKDTWALNIVNNNASHPCMQIEMASDDYPPFGNTVHSFTRNTSPAAKSWSGNATGYDITNITFTNYSASFICQAGSNTLFGYVKDVNGNAVSGAKVEINKSVVTPSSTKSILFAAPLLASASSSGLTDSNGYFEISMDGYTDNACAISIYKEGFVATNSSFNYSSGYQQRDFILQRATIHSDASLKKYQTDGNYSMGSNTGTVLYAGIRYTENELKKYSGYKINNVSAKLDISSGMEVTLFVIAGDRYLLEKDVTSSIVSGSISTINIEDSDIKIDTSGDLIIAFKVKATSLVGKYPFYYESGEPNVGGNLYSTDGYNWNKWGEGNFIISAGLSYKSEELFNASGINYIQRDKIHYSAGDQFVLKMVKSSVNPYSSVVWKVNSETKSDGASINLTSGVTEIQAILTYPSGKIEIVTSIIRIE